MNAEDGGDGMRSAIGRGSARRARQWRETTHEQKMAPESSPNRRREGSGLTSAAAEEEEGSSVEGEEVGGEAETTTS